MAPPLPADATAVASLPPRGRTARFLAVVGPDFFLVLFFGATLVGLIAAYGASFKWKEGPILVSAGIAALLVGARFLWKAPSILLDRPGARHAFATSALVILRDWGPLIIIMWMFQSLETYTGVIRKVSIDDALYHMDLAIFGVEPTQWMGKLFHPLLTDYMSLAYGLYFIMPMLLATMLSVRGRRADFREMCIAVVLQMGIAFVLFLCFPAGPPRYYGPLVHGGFDPPQLHSYFGLFELQQGAFDSADPVRTRSAFPSLHCSLALLTLIYAWRFGSAVFGERHPKLYFWIILPLVVSLWVSTVYLRHHWIPDIAAGMLVGTAAQLIAPWLRRRWPQPARI
jgi:membrane-associated phospholipid phosphatase